jgi:hypothetical protein
LTALIATLSETGDNGGLSISVLLGILQHAKIIDWQRFAPYREPVLNRISGTCKKG